MDTSASAFIPKPRRPQAVESPGINYSSAAAGTKGLHTNVNYLMEMMKFFPDYERKLYAGADQSSIIESESQYAAPVVSNDVLSPQFGNVVRSMSGEIIRANAQAKGVNGLQFDDKAMADYEHLDGQTLSDLPVTVGLSKDLWQKVQAALKNEKGSYYDAMMQNSLANASPEKAFYVMVSMLESRSRVNAGMSDIFGSPTMTGAERKAVFDSWYQQNKSNYSAGEIGFLKFFLDIQQAFVAHANPMFGGSTEQVVSSLDQTRAQQFTDTLTEKVTAYLDSQDPPDSKLVALWESFINPESALPTAAQNTDPLSDASMDGVYKKLTAAIDTLIDGSMGSKSVTRSRQKKYKEEMITYEDQIDEERQLEYDQQKSISKNQAQTKADLAKSTAKSNAERANLEKMQRNAAAAKPVAVQRTRSAMANKVSIRTQPAATAATPAVIKSQQHKTTASRPITVNAAPTVAGSSKRAVTASKARAPLRNAAKPLSARPKGILSAVVSNVYKKSGASSVKRQPKSKLSVS